MSGRTENISDRDAIMMWRRSLDRRAFRNPFQWWSFEEQWDKYGKALENTHNAINKGVLKDGNGKVVQQTKGRGSITNNSWQLIMNEIEQDLKELIEILGRLKNHMDDRDIETTDKLRDKIIMKFNMILDELRIPRIKRLSEVIAYEEIANEEI